MSRHDTEKLEDALEILRKAAEESGDELKSLFAGKYADLRDTVLDLDGAIAEKLASLASRVARARNIGERKVQALGMDIDRRVHEDAWKVIGWSALGALLAGFLVGRKRR